MGRQRLRSQQVNLALVSFRKAAEEEPKNLRTAFWVAWCLYELVLSDAIDRSIV